MLSKGPKKIIAVMFSSRIYWIRWVRKMIFMIHFLFLKHPKAQNLNSLSAISLKKYPNLNKLRAFPPIILLILKSHSLMLNRGHSQNFQNLFFLHIFVALLYEAHFLKGIRLKSFQYEMRAIFSQKIHVQDFIQHSSLGEQWNTHNHA